MARESITRTISVAVAVALVCSALVSAAVYVLRPIQSAYAHLERNRAIVAAALGSERASAMSDQAIIAAFLDMDARVLELPAGKLVDTMNAHAFDHWTTEPGSEAADSRLVPVYFVEPGANGAVLVLPVDGRGMWSTIYGYVALEADLNTVAGIAFYRHGETPGVGDRIERPQWLGSWRGKRIYDAVGMPRIHVAAGGAADAYRVDVIAGASVTSEAVGRLVNEWFGQAGYGPWLASRRQRSGPSADVEE